MATATWQRHLVAVRRFRWLVLGVFAGLALLGMVYVATLPTSYEASGVISFQPREGEINGEDLISLLVQRYPAVAESTPVVGRAATAAGVSSSTVTSGLSALVQPSSANLILTVTLDSAQQAVIANQSIYQSVMESNLTDPYLEALQVEAPSQVAKALGVPKALLAGAVLFLSAVVAVLVGLLADQLSRRRT
ncbi:MAG: hypothetical protein QG597_4611 [Actinomycetota bacterium]|nr:hypothetical protein [Actinomycetota bacterium]